VDFSIKIFNVSRHLVDKVLETNVKHVQVQMWIVTFMEIAMSNHLKLLQMMNLLNVRILDQNYALWNILTLVHSMSSLVIQIPVKRVQEIIVVHVQIVKL
jgi:hypothetical protein